MGSFAVCATSFSTGTRSTLPPSGACSGIAASNHCFCQPGVRTSTPMRKGSSYPRNPSAWGESSLSARRTCGLPFEFVDHYHEERPHQGLGNELIAPQAKGIGTGPLKCRERLGGVLKFYYREAA